MLPCVKRLFTFFDFERCIACGFVRMSGRIFVNCCFLLRRGAVLPSYPFIIFLSILLERFFLLLESGLGFTGGGFLLMSLLFTTDCQGRN